ncbi:MAG TPA: FkbM family methyltransferase [Solirubrobacteraceae bacterium]|nr:FkbM family methyltransferase [Solirubrobacteraceae bacterium]
MTLGQGVSEVVRRRAGTLAYLARVGRLSPDWPAIARGKLTHTTPERPIRLRDGTVLHHGDLDDPLLMLHEVWVEELYRPAVPPPPGATMIDAGANIGAVALYWLAREPTLRVHAYEPNPCALTALHRNARANAAAAGGGELTVHEEALGAGRGELDLWIDGPSYEATGYRDEPPAGASRRIPVPVVGLDEAWERLGRGPVWLLKIDTEGAEADILAGASSDTLAAVRCAIVEYHDDIYPGSADRCRALLRSARLTVDRETAFDWGQGILYASRH